MHNRIVVEIIGFEYEIWINRIEFNENRGKMCFQTYKSTPDESILK